MSKSNKSGSWPARFPILRALGALAIIPLLTPLLYLSIAAALNSGPSSVPGESGALSLQSVLGFVLIFSVPGYIVFVILGFPILYVLHYFKCSAFWIFVVAGLFCTMAPFAGNALNQRPGHLISGSQIAHNILGQLVFSMESSRGSLYSGGGRLELLKHEMRTNSLRIYSAIC
jgi:hypothetical protein